jgi:c-di-GMP-binding flagellar brake protein YcgR
MNRRGEPRFDVYYRATITPVDNPDSQIDALLTDISGGGMRLVAMQELPED